MNDELLDETSRQTLALFFLDEAYEHLDAMRDAFLTSVPETDRWVDVLRHLHTLKGSAGSIGYKRVESAAHRIEDWIEAQLEQQRQQRREFVLHQREVQQFLKLIEQVRALVLEEKNGVGDSVHTIERSLAEFTHSAESSPTELLEVTLRRSRLLTAEVEAQAQDDRREFRERRKEDGRFVRVDVQRLDDLNTTAEQLVLDRTRIERHIERLRLMFSSMSLDDAPETMPALEALSQACRSLRRSTIQLQERLTHVRMTPIRWLFERLQRSVLEMAQSEGKSVAFEVYGAETEADRSVLQRLLEPVGQLLRNAVVHGIERPVKRLHLGKESTGKISLKAHHDGEFFYLYIEDDGEGIQPAKLRDALQQSSLAMSDWEKLNDSELLEVIFTPGFTTRDEVDHLAGRGIGLDIVRREIVALGGDVSVESESQRFCRFTIRLPINTAVAQVYLFKAEGYSYGISAIHVEDAYDIQAEAIRTQGRGWLYEVSLPSGIVPLISFGKVLGKTSAALPIRHGILSIVVLTVGNMRIAIACDKVIGRRDVVLKSLDPLLRLNPLLASATLSGSGRVQWILNPATLTAFVRRHKPNDKGGRSGSVRSTTKKPLQGFRILLADDSRSVRTVLIELLETAGAEVDVAQDGDAAWKRLCDERYDLLISDLEMPKLHGIELIGRCRREQNLARLPILVLTSRATTENETLARRHGADGFLSKTALRDRLLDKVSSMLIKKT